MPATGVIDSSADITILGAELFKLVASVARLKKSAFKKPEKTPYTYDHQPFSLDGKLELDVTLDDRTMHTSVYVKMDAYDSLLLSEGVCHQLGIIKYHPSVGASIPTIPSSSEDAHVPVVRVKLIHSVRIPPMKCAVVPVQLVGERPGHGLTLLEPLCVDDLPQLASSLDGRARTLQHVIHKPHRLHSETGEGYDCGGGHRRRVCFSQQWCWWGRCGRNGCGGDGVGDADVVVGGGAGGRVEEVMGGEEGQPSINSIKPSDVTKPSRHNVRRVHGNMTERKRKLGELLAEVGPTLSWQEKDRLRQLLLSHHRAFAIEEGDRGETDLILMTIDTGDALPRRQPVRRTPFAVRTEVARQLQEMQSQGVRTLLQPMDQSGCAGS